MNYLHKFYLVEAEKARVSGQFFEAEELYERAIAGTADNEHIQEEALAYELAAKHGLIEPSKELSMSVRIGLSSSRTSQTLTQSCSARQLSVTLPGPSGTILVLTAMVCSLDMRGVAISGIEADQIKWSRLYMETV